MKSLKQKCYASAVSTVRIKIEEKIGAKWRVLSLINMSVPMGC
mgnify:CR=1 FL=1